MKKIILLLMTMLSGAAAGAGGFLFVTFKGEQTPLSEQLYFAVSEDGRKWEALNAAEPVLVSALGEKGVRDPYLLRAPGGKKFYLLATDLSIHLNHDWTRAQTAASQSIVIWESTNLVDWSSPRLVKVAPDDAGCTWAPEAVYDESRAEYLVFWASKTKGDKFKKQRIWAAWTKDFVTFSQPFIYIDKPFDVIDTDIVRENGHYYRFSKDEAFKAITMEVSTNLLGPWNDVTNFSLAKMQGYEGPECYQIKPAAEGRPASWCLILDHYRKGNGYEPFVTEDLSGGQFQPGNGFAFPFRFRHGSLLPITAEELNALKTAYGQPAKKNAAPLIDGQPKNETQLSARRENFPVNTNLPSLFLIGDSTVRNGRGDGSGGQWGWGDQLAPFFDTSKINVVNRALGGTTTRTYYRDFWPRTLALMKAGDVVILQFGTNGGPINDASRARGEIHGIGDESQDITNQVTKQFETVRTFGWYERQMISEARAKGVTPVICSLIPRNTWREGKTARPGGDSPAAWAAQAAQAANAPFIDLNEIIARRYDELGQEKVKELFVANAGPHTSLAGAQTNAICVVAGLKAIKENPLVKFFSEKANSVPPTGRSQAASGAIETK